MQPYARIQKLIIKKQTKTRMTFKIGRLVTFISQPHVASNFFNFKHFRKSKHMKTCEYKLFIH